MGSADDLLHSLYQRGVKIWAEDGLLRYRAPQGVLHSEEMDQLRTLRSEIVRLLVQREPSLEIPLAPRVADCPVPLTPSQLRWISASRERSEGVSERMCSIAMRIIGPLDVDLLRRCLAILSERHESLRTRIVVTDGVPRQHIDSACRDPLEQIDVSELPPAEAEGEATRLCEEFVGEKINLSLGPLFSTKLLRLSSSDHVLILALDRLITDGVSNSILTREIWTLYRQGAQGRPLSLPKLPFQFADFSIWQQQTYGAWRAKHEAYWRGRLASAPYTLLPLNNRLPEANEAAYAIRTLSFGETLSAKLQDIARREQTLLSLIVLSIYVVVVSRWCNQRDLVLKFASRGRGSRELQNIVGFLANFLHLRIEIARNDTFLDLLKRVTLEFRAALEHQDFDRVPDLLPNCATEIYFNWLPTDQTFNWALTNWSRSSATHNQQVHDNLRVQPFPLKVTWPADFIPMFSHTEDGIYVTLAYRADLFSGIIIERFFHNLRSFAEELSRCPLGRLDSVLIKEESLSIV